MSALSYELTCEIKVKRFGTSDLVRAYQQIHERFRLPADEAEQVAKEIESHTGLIIQFGDDAFEFTHLCLQEYLCANYLVRDPFAAKTLTYLQEYPAPLAVAIAVAANPSNWIANLCLNPNAFVGTEKHQIESLISRLAQEIPFFEPSLELGFTVLRIMFAFQGSTSVSIKKLLEFPNVADALRRALTQYSVVKGRSSAGRILLQRTESTAVTKSGLTPPSEGFVSSDFFEEYSDRSN